MGESGQSGRIPELDGLRGIAIGMVLVYHYFYLTIVTTAHTPVYYAMVPFRMTWTGVDLFFALSGFLIGGILLKAREATNYFAVFYLRRALRIVPVYAAFLLVSFAVLGAVRSYGGQRFEWISAKELPQLPFWVFLQNFWMTERNTLGAFGLGVTWSLSVEEQFYLTLPLLVRVFDKKRLLILVIAGIVLAPAIRISLFKLWPSNNFSYFVLMPCRADALLLGVLGAMAVRERRVREWMASHRKEFGWILAILAMGGAALGKLSPGMQDKLMVSVGYTWMAMLYAGVLVYAISWQESAIGRFLRMEWLRWLGGIAYGTYLFHMVILAGAFSVFRGTAPRILAWSDAGVTMAALAATLGMCWVSWIYFEKPLVGIGHQTEYEFGERVRCVEAAE